MSQTSAKAQVTLSTMVEESLKGIDIIRTEDRRIFAADLKKIRATPTPKNTILPAPVAEISNLYAESLRDVQKESGIQGGIPVFAGGMAILSSLPVYVVPNKTALQALHRIFYIAKQKGISSVNEEAFACWQTHCLRNPDKKTSAAMLIVDAGAGSKQERDMLRQCGYQCPAEPDDAQ